MHITAPSRRYTWYYTVCARMLRAVSPPCVSMRVRVAVHTSAPSMKQPVTYSSIYTMASMLRPCISLTVVHPLKSRSVLLVRNQSIMLVLTSLLVMARNQEHRFKCSRCQLVVYTLWDLSWFRPTAAGVLKRCGSAATTCGRDNRSWLRAVVLQYT